MSRPEKQRQRAQRDVARPIDGSEPRVFPSFDNLAQWVVTQGLAKDVEAVRSDPGLWQELLFQWYESGQIACIFAISLARQSTEANWRSAVVQEEWDADLITAIVDAHIEIGAEGLQILFPGEGSAAEALNILKQLAAHPRWRCEDTGWLPGEDGDSIHIGLRWVAPDGAYESWAIGIAPFEPMPFTRRFTGAPFIALVIRPLPPAGDRAPTPSGCSGLPASHLAHMDDLLADNSYKRGRWMDQTKLAKRALIHPDPLSRARAKVTFSLSADFRQELAPLLNQRLPD